MFTGRAWRDRTEGKIFIKKSDVFLLSLATYYNSSFTENIFYFSKIQH